MVQRKAFFRALVFSSLLAVLPAAFLQAQTPPPIPQAETGAAALPRTFRQLGLGMGLDDLKAALRADGLFQFRGDPDVSFLPRREENLVEVTGLSFVRRAFFQLRDGKVFIMAFSLDAALVDHYAVYTALVKKYGEPRNISPRESVWETENLRLSVERPLTVKYIDLAVWRQLAAESETQAGSEIQERQEFLDDF